MLRTFIVHIAPVSDYVQNRCECVSIEGASSQEQITSAGVPHGLIIGPLLFLTQIMAVFNMSIVDIFSF